MGSRKKASRKRGKSEVTLLIVGACLCLPAILHRGPVALESGQALAGLLLIALGAVKGGMRLMQGRELPKKEVMRLAESRNGLVTLSEVATALDIDPTVAEKTLKALSKSGIAQQRWQELRKNLWEFPDYMKLPLSETINLARQKGGRVSLSDLIASGQSVDVAAQTLDALAERGLAQQDPSVTSRTMKLITQ